MTVAFEVLSIPVSGGSGTKIEHGTAVFNGDVRSYETAIKGFLFDYSDSDHHINVIEVTTGRPRDPDPDPPLGRARVEVVCQYADRNSDDAYTGRVDVLVVAHVVPVDIAIDLNGKWSDGTTSTSRAVISVAFPFLTINMSAFNCPAASGSVLSGSSIEVTFPDDRSYTGILQPPNTIRWDNGTAWTKV